jgi:hypothetical protein
LVRRQDSIKAAVDEERGHLKFRQGRANSVGG